MLLTLHMNLTVITLSHNVGWITPCTGAVAFTVLSKVKSKMSDVNIYVRRVAQLCNLVSKPELNGSYVFVQSYDAGKERFAVCTLVAPNAPSTASVSMSIKGTSLQLRADITFASRFPKANVVQASMLMNEIEPGTILDFSQSQPAPLSLMEQVILIFDHSCLCRGAPSNLDSAGIACPRTTIQNDVCIEVEDDGIVEFEDLNFESVIEKGGIWVSKARHVAFRRCRFRGSMHGIAVGLSKESCAATFESCVFEQSPRSDIVVKENAHVTMINCLLRGPKICVDVEDRGSFSAIHCQFFGEVRGLSKVPSFDLLNCTVADVPGNGITVANATTARLRGCRVMRCVREGIVVKGPKRVNVEIEDCVVTQCNMGFLFAMGKITATLRNCDAFDNKYHGIHLGKTLNGSVDMTNCKFTGNHGAMDVVKMCGRDCPVTIDYVQLPLNVDPSAWKRAMADIRELAVMDIEKDGECRVALAQRRALKQVLQGPAPYLHCLNCLKPEPLTTKFKVCGKCEEEVYCSRDCQVAHWKQHKIECGKVAYG